MDDSSRKEPFRYVMNQPIECWLEDHSSGFGHGTGKLTEGWLLDLSPSGCKIRTPLNLRFTAGDTKLTIHFRLSEAMMQFEGSVRWGWMFGIGQYQYGIRLNLQEEEEALLLRELDLWTSGRRAEGL